MDAEVNLRQRLLLPDSANGIVDLGDALIIAAGIGYRGGVGHLLVFCVHDGRAVVGDAPQACDGVSP